MSSKKIKFLLTSLLALTAITTTVSTVSWFITRQSVTTDGEKGIDGSVLQSYFHHGTGKKDDPFTITTPWHYENFIKLHYTVKDFAEGGFYFQFGDTYNMPSGTTVPTFYATNDKGIVDYNNTSDILNLGGMNLPPLGTDAKPFIGALEGSGLTISNFTVSGNGMTDVGIFGYVSHKIDPETGKTERATIDNCYWKNFKISTNGAKPSWFPHEQEEHKHDDKVEVGYLAGHVVDAGSFTNCYINSCKIDTTGTQGTGEDLVNDTFGYYGKAEIDSIGGQTGKGHDYKYTLDSKAVFQTFNQNYNTTGDYPIRTRPDDPKNGKYYANYKAPFHNPEIVDSVATDPLSDAVTKTNNQTYVLNGKTTSDKNYERNYSLSSLGYQPLVGGEKKEYEVTYGNNRNLIPPENAEVVNGELPTIETQNKPGEFIGRRSGDQQWYYQHSENDNTTYVPEKEFTFNFSTISEFSVSETAGDRNPSMYDANAYFYLDDKVYTSKVTCNIQRTGSVFNYKYRIYNISISDANFRNLKVKLQRGLHYYAFFLAFATTNNAMRFAYIDDVAHQSTDPAGYNPGSGTKVSMSGANAKNWDVTKGTLNIGVEDYIRGTFTFYGSNYDGDNCTVSNQNPTITITNASAKWDGTIPQYVNPNTKDNSLYGTNIRDENPQPELLRDDGMKFSKQYYYDSKEGVINGYYYNGNFYLTSVPGGGFTDKVTPQEGVVYQDIGTGSPIPYIWNGSSYQANQIIGGYLKDGNFYTDEGCTNLITPQVGKYYQNKFDDSYYRYDGVEYLNVNQVRRYKWMAENTPERQVDPDESHNVFIGDDEILEESGYNHENIDIVGGGVSFYYLERILFWTVDLRVISLPSENTSNYIVNRINQTQTDIGKYFTSTEYCPGSVVMYVKNYSNAADEIDHDLGQVSFTYVNLSIGGSSRINIEEPAFKKGAGEFVSVRNMGKQTGGETLDFTTTFECNITEAGAKRSSYCALDKEGRILGYFDANGNPGDGFKNPDGTPNVEQLLKIDTYVIVLGAKANTRNLYPAYVTNVNFSYKAKEGYGGTFGSVGYRDALDRITSTILNFNFNSPYANSFTITVQFVKRQDEPTEEDPILGVYYVDITSSSKVTVNIFNYDTKHYQVVVNGGDPSQLENIVVEVET